MLVKLALWLFVLFRSKSLLSHFQLRCIAAQDTDVFHNDDNGNATTLSGIPLLPEPKEDHEGVRKMSLGETVKMDDLGPIIINPDGTTRRIANWDTLSPQEKASSWRLIGARNKRRVEALQKQRELESNSEKAEGDVSDNSSN